MIDQQIVNTLQKFIILISELSILFIGISFFVQIIQSKLSNTKIQLILGNDKSPKAYILSALLGSVTPFCTCSTIPMLKGMFNAKVGFGPSITFLLTSPLVNPIIITLFISMIGWQITIFYIIFSLFFSIVTGVLLSQLNFQKHLKYNVYEETNNSCCSEVSCTTTKSTNTSSFKQYLNSSLKDFFNILPYLIISCFIGAITYSYIPTELLQKYIGQDNAMAIPIAAIIGIPLYIRASVLIPLVSVLIEKGVSIGAMIALIIGGAGASLPELVLLKSLFKKELLIAFIVAVLSMAVSAGYFVQLIFT